MKPLVFDVIILGAGASGLMTAIEAGKRGRKVLVLDHANKAGKKILMSGGGRCNFTNLTIDAENYLSRNPHFCKSALSRYTQWHFLALVEQYGIPWHERDHGQCFCDRSAKDILSMLLTECQLSSVSIQLNTSVHGVEKKEGYFELLTTEGQYIAQSFVIATGGLSIPKMGATPFGYRIAEQFSIPVVPTHAGLVPLTWHQQDKQRFAPLSGIAVEADVMLGKVQFRENLLFTHRGLSGPVILQISSYWRPGDPVTINLLPDLDIKHWLEQWRKKSKDIQLLTALSTVLPKKLCRTLLAEQLAQMPLKQLTPANEQHIVQALQHWTFKPNGTEGYRTAEVTVGGVDCDALSSKTMESKQLAGLYFVGEVVDVTGWLGGYNFQWAWSSGWCAGQVV
jgi:predicted Rossmann fold flavoprotein